MTVLLTGDPRIYVRILDSVKNDIDRGILGRGKPCSSIGDLCGKFGCGRQTVGKALSLLEAEGYLVRIPGLGYYVTGAGR